MAETKRSLSLSIEDNERLSEVVRQFPCLYDKSKKEYKDKNVVENAWKNVAQNLDFIPDGKARFFSLYTDIFMV